MDPSKEKSLVEKVALCRSKLTNFMINNTKWFYPTCEDLDKFDKWDAEYLDDTVNELHRMRILLEKNLKNAIAELDQYTTVEQPKQAAAEYKKMWENAPTLADAYRKK